MLCSHTICGMIDAKHLSPQGVPLQAFAAHKESVRGVCMAPGDLKFATASDDSTVKVQRCAVPVPSSTARFPRGEATVLCAPGAHPALHVAKRSKLVLRVADLGLQAGAVRGGHVGARRGT